MIRDGKVYQVESYQSADNVPNESFVNGRAMKLDDGTIVMQSLDHVVTFNVNEFNPERIRKLVLAPKLIRLMVNGHFIGAGTRLDGRNQAGRQGDSGPCRFQSEGDYGGL